MKEMLVNINSKEVRVAHLGDKQLTSLVVERSKSRQTTGNIYCGYVTNILQNIQSAFIDVGEASNGFIHISDILENSQKFQELFDMDFEWDKTPKLGKKEKNSDIVKFLKLDQKVLVQVVKEPIGNKGVRLTSNISIPGRFLVLLPNNNHRGVSKKISNREIRSLLKKQINSLDMPTNMGLICRTTSVHATKEQLLEETNQLLNIWEKIMIKFENAKSATCLYKESDLIKKSLMTALDKKYDSLIIDHYPTYLNCNRMFKRYKEEGHPLRVKFYKERGQIFKKFNVEKEVEKALMKKIWLQGGGYLFFDETEAMHTIDVNSGKSQMNENNQNLEESLFQVNMEAACEIAKQLSIRNIGGLIVCDFIDMSSKKNQKRVLDKMKDLMRDDSVKCTILDMSKFGLVQMTRQRIRESLADTMLTKCPYCEGNGMIKNFETSSMEIERALLHLIKQDKHLEIRITVHPIFYEYMEKAYIPILKKLSSKMGANIEFSKSEKLHMNDYLFFSIPTGDILEYEI